MFFNLLPVSSSVTETLFWQYPDEEQKGAQQGQSTLELQLPGPLPTSTVSSPPHTFPFHETQVTVGVRVVRPAIPINHPFQSCTSWSVPHRLTYIAIYGLCQAITWRAAIPSSLRSFVIRISVFATGIVCVRGIFVCSCPSFYSHPTWIGCALLAHYCLLNLIKYQLTIRIFIRVTITVICDLTPQLFGNITTIS